MKISELAEIYAEVDDFLKVELNDFLLWLIQKGYLSTWSADLIRIIIEEYLKENP